MMFIEKDKIKRVKKITDLAEMAFIILATKGVEGFTVNDETITIDEAKELVEQVYNDFIE